MNDKISKGGAKTWYFPDGYLPVKSTGQMEAHEAIMIQNVSEHVANIKMDIYFEDKEAIKDIAIVVAGERVISLRMDLPAHIGGVHPFSYPIRCPITLRYPGSRDVRPVRYHAVQHGILYSKRILGINPDPD